MNDSDIAFVYLSSFKMVNLLETYCTKREGTYKTKKETIIKLTSCIHGCGVFAGLGKCQQSNSMLQPNS